MKNIEESGGYKKLLASVMRDVEEGQKCFNPGGCNHEFTRTEPQENQALLKMGMTTQCRHVSSCFHKYCDKFKWAIDRAKHYAQKTGLEAADVLDSWEAGRTYWYMNYYQDSNQPEIGAEKVHVFDTIKDFRNSVRHKGFRCPLCSGVSKSPYRCDTGTIVKKVKDGKDGPCNWSVGGLFQDMGKGAYIFVKEKISGELIFMPVAWEQKEQV